MNLNFITDLNESSQYRTKQILQSKNINDISVHAFLDLIVLWILYNEYDYAPVAVEYSKKTIQFGNFDLYRQSGTDLYIALYALIGNDSSSKNNTLNKNTIITFLKKIINNELKSTTAREFLQKYERDLKIDNISHRTLRRMAQNWGLLSQEQKSFVISRIVMAYKKYAPKSELYYIIKTFSEDKNLDIDDIEDVDTNINSVAKIAYIGTSSTKSKE